MAEGLDSSKKITITVKTPKEKIQIEISEDADIKDVSAGDNFIVAHIVVDRLITNFVFDLLFATINKKISFQKTSRTFFFLDCQLRVGIALLICF